MAAVFGMQIKPVLALLTLLVAVFLQAAVNTLNDYRDFASGLDNADNCDDPTDAALIYSSASPRAALVTGCIFLLCAAGCGALIVVQTGWQVILFAAAGGAAILLYTMPGFSLSDLPLGELLSGLAMGGVLTWAAFYIQASQLDLRAVLMSLPLILTIGCIMLGNNTSDIEKDRASRRTFPVLVGRRKAAVTLRIAEIAAAVIAAVCICLFARQGIVMIPVMVPALLLSKPVRHLYLDRLVPSERGMTMHGVIGAHTRISVCYIAALLLHVLAQAPHITQSPIL